jgi:MSHA pilin protein MshA
MHIGARGFTRIELAVVLAVMAMLASFAIPRFTSIENEGRIAAIASLSASIRNASALAHAQWLASGRPDTIDVEGQAVTMRNGYPDAGQTGLPTALPDAAGFSATIGNGAVIYKKSGAPKPDQCSVVYSPPATSGSPPKILLYTPNLSGC